ncbi:MAG TPA: flagellar assembly protein FliW [Cerasibacillus sp.]|uniref:flagellar assembly protein FliW n=1 Tax=Cerasibacillus sp. TaxID=2498711 RepID=UPI002F410274
MQIKTKYLGDLSIHEDRVIQFPDGLPGFPNHKQFILLELPGNPVFNILQSIQEKDLAFIVTSPYHFYSSYAFDLSQSIIDRLQIETESDVDVLSIVTIAEPFSKSTINLKAPLIFNIRKKYGKQYILNDVDYPIKAPMTSSQKVKGE